MSDSPKAADIGAFDVTPSWERAEVPGERPIVDPFARDVGCQCGLCQLAAGGHL
jgi:hypothetical protein